MTKQTDTTAASAMLEPHFGIDPAHPKTRRERDQLVTWA